MHDTSARSGFRDVILSELPCWAGLATVLVFLSVGSGWLANLSNPLVYSALFAWLCGAILWAAFGVTKHADCLAIMLGEPYGTLLLTLAVTGLEVIMIVAVAVNGADNPTLARDTMFSVIMIQLNGLIGLCLLIGGLRHREQSFNLQGNSAFLAVIAALTGIALVLPRFADIPHWFLAIATFLLYGTFLGIQTMRHQGYFRYPDVGETEGGAPAHVGMRTRSRAYHTFFLLLTMLPVVLLAKSFAILIDHGVEHVGAPAALGGLVIAILVLSPEALSAVNAAAANRLQRADNIILGATLATVGLTVPGVLIVIQITGNGIDLGLDNAEIALLAVTLLISMINVTAGRTNILQGLVHVTLFATFLAVVFT